MHGYEYLEAGSDCDLVRVFSLKQLYKNEAFYWSFDGGFGVGNA